METWLWRMGRDKTLFNSIYLLLINVIAYDSK